MNQNTFKNILKISAAMFVFACLFSPLFNTVIANDDTYTLLEPLPVPGGETIKETDGIGKYLEGVFKLGIGLATVLAVLMITIGGLQYMTSDKIQLKADSKTTITNALWGLVLILASFLLLKTINPDFIESTLDLKPVEPAQSGGGSEEDKEDTKICWCSGGYCYANKPVAQSFVETVVPIDKECH